MFRLRFLACLVVLSAGISPRASRGDDVYSDEERSHWSLQPRKLPAVPVFRQANDGPWLANPIDAFIAAHLQTAELPPSPTADHRTLIRRLSFNLLGLPPCPEEIEAFETDSTPDAYERLVDRLLANP